MKTLEIRIQSDGVVRRKISDEVFDGENDTLAVTIDFSLTDYSDWEKRCEVVVENGAKGIKLGSSFLLGSEYLKKGATLLQPMATKGDLVVKFPVIKIAVARSLNVLEGDTSVTLSVAEEVLQDIELFKIDVDGKLALQDTSIANRLGGQDTKIASNHTATLVEVDRRATIQDTKIDDKVAQIDSQLSEQDILVADLELKLAQSEAKVSELMAMNNDKTWGRFT